MTVVHGDVDAFPSSSRSACTRVDGTLRNDDEDDDDGDRGGGVRRLDVDVDATMRRLVVGMNESEAKSDDTTPVWLTSQLKAHVTSGVSCSGVSTRRERRTRDVGRGGTTCGTTRGDAAAVRATRRERRESDGG